MSIYHARLSNGRHIFWGFDRMLEEYFIREHKSADEIEKEQEAMNGNLYTFEEFEPPNMMVYNISNHSTVRPHPDTPEQLEYANSEILEHMLKYKDYIPLEHLEAVTMDIPY